MSTMVTVSVMWQVERSLHASTCCCLFCLVSTSLQSDFVPWLIKVKIKNSFIFFIVVGYVQKEPVKSVVMVIPQTCAPSTWCFLVMAHCSMCAHAEINYNLSKNNLCFLPHVFCLKLFWASWYHIHKGKSPQTFTYILLKSKFSLTPPAKSICTHPILSKF